MIGFLYDLVNEVDFLAAIGPIEYVKDKASDIGWAINNALGVDEDDDDGNANDGDMGVNKIETEESDDKLIEEANDFLNDHMSEIQTVIAKTVVQADPTKYNSQQEYLNDVFKLSGEACCSYIQDIFYDPGISTELSHKITETMVKAAAVIVASAMFVEWALRQNPEESTDKYEEEEGGTL